MPHRHPQDLSLQARERQVIEALAAMHAELDDDGWFEQRAIEMIYGEPLPGTLASLATLGYVRQEMDESGPIYQLTPKGFETAKRPTFEAR